MTETPEDLANPVLSPGFDRARLLSRILVVLLTIGLVIGVIAIVGYTAYLILPELQTFVAKHSRHPVPRLSGGKYLLHLVSFAAGFLAILSARRLFARFAAGDVFSAGTIAQMRAAAMWVTIAGVLPPRPLTLIVGMAVYVAAYVMVEARRLADEAAGIV